MFANKQADGAQRIRAAVTPALVPGEELVGVMHAGRKAAFSSKIYAIGVTDQRLVMVELDRKLGPTGTPPISIRSTDITKSSVDGSGGGAKHYIAALGSASVPEIRFDTSNEKYKFYVTGGLTGEKLMGADYMTGLEAVCEFIWSATH